MPLTAAIRGTRRRAIPAVVALMVLSAGLARGDAPAPLDWEAWQRMPVLHDGRLKPLDSFARTVVRGLCGRENPRLQLPDEALQSSDPAWARARELFPGGQPRTFLASEALFSWLVEPDNWERVPFLTASNEELREKGLGVPVRDKQGNHLKFVSPYDVAGSRRFAPALEDLTRRQAAARSDLKVFHSTPLDQQLRRFYDAYATYRGIALEPSLAGGAGGQFRESLAGAIRLWMKLGPDLALVPDSVGRPFQAVPDGPEGSSYAQQAGDAMRRLMEVVGSLRESGTRINPAELEAPLVAMRTSALKLADQAEAARDRLQQSSATDAKEHEERLVRLRTLASQLNELSRLVTEAQVGLYSTGHSLAVVPAIHAAALEEKRDPREGAQPWLSLQIVLTGSELLLQPYPKAELDSVRQAFQELRRVYLDRQAADRAERFRVAMENFTSAVELLGRAIEPLREQLPIKDRDAALMAATAYPAAGAMDLEVFYNSFDPFTWSWILSLVAVVCFLLTPQQNELSRTRRAAFWLGLALLLAAQACTIAGLGMRIIVTGRAPVTNMFETIVFVALVAALMGTCFALTPLLARGFEIAWRLTGRPWQQRVSAANGGQAWPDYDRSTWRTANWLIFSVRLILTGAIFYLLAIVSYGASADETVIRLAPRVAMDAAMPSLGDLMAWAVGLGVLGVAMWFVPRAILTAVLALVLVPACLAREGIGEPLQEVVARKAFAVAGAAVACLAAYVACNATVFDKNISPIMPVLRNNFWLTTHVLTITASYGAGALAWGLANIALGYYLFGRYRKWDEGPAAARGQAARHETPRRARAAGQQANPEPVEESGRATHRRPPESCAVLATYIYKAAQVAVVLLIAGTVLGALWADVSWGRFWGWDSKEVWALISALVYLAILHGRYAGLFGHLGMAVGAVFGATSILLAWYGVNYLFGSGLHTYGSGTGGQFWVILGLGLNWAFVAAALVRHRIETAIPTRTQGTRARARSANRGPQPVPTFRTNSRAL